MKKYQIEIKGKKIEIIQDDDGKFIKPEYVKEQEQFGTCLKPAYEPVIVARKPFNGSLLDNIIENGVGGFNIDECRVPLTENEPDSRVGTDAVMHTAGDKMWYGENRYAGTDVKVYKENGRFPANVITDGSDEVAEGFPNTKSNGGKTTMPDFRDVGQKSKEAIGIDKLSFGQIGKAERKEYSYIAPADEVSAMRYFYCAKASKKDRDEGLDCFYELDKDTPEEIKYEIQKILGIDII